MFRQTLGFARRTIFAGLPLLVCCVLLISVAEACPTCKDGVANGTNHTNVIRGYFWSIVFMMSMPFLIFGGLGLYFFLQVQRARQNIQQKKSSTLVPTSD